MIIGLTGKLHSGKDTVARLITQIYGQDKCECMAFADTIKEIGSMFGFTKEQMYDQTLKEKECNELFKITPRKFCISVGKSFKNILGDDCWVKLLSKRLERSTSDIKIITDIRFNYEAEYISAIGGCIFKIERDEDRAVSESVRSDSTENGIEESYISATIINNSTISDLESKLRVILSELGLPSTRAKFNVQDIVFVIPLGDYRKIIDINSGYYKVEGCSEGLRDKDICPTVIEPYTFFELRKKIGSVVQIRNTQGVFIITGVTEDRIFLGQYSLTYEESSKELMEHGLPFGKFSFST